MKPWIQDGIAIDKGQLQIELTQCADEGKDLGPLQSEFDALLAADLDNDLALQAARGQAAGSHAAAAAQDGLPVQGAQRPGGHPQGPPPAARSCRSWP